MLKDNIREKNKIYMFIGYGLDGIRYCFLSDKSNSIIRSKDVIFNKNSLYKDNIKVDNERKKKPHVKHQVVLHVGY